MENTEGRKSGDRISHPAYSWNFLCPFMLGSISSSEQFKVGMGCPRSLPVLRFCDSKKARSVSEESLFHRIQAAVLGELATGKLITLEARK